MAGLGEKTVENVLKDFGLTEKEVEVYVFLAKHGVLKSREVARQIRKDKAQVLRILKSLQSKGLVESTLEAPKRFTAVPFENVLDAFVKAKRDEAALIESTKKDLLLYWKSIGKTRPEAPLEKFVVIEGTNKIYSKISQMITETKNQLLTISTIPSLIRADQLGLFDAVSSHPLRSNVQLRFLTELSGQSSNAITALLEKASKARINFRWKNPDLGLRPFPRMVIRDDEEVLLFITPRAETPRDKQVDTGIWTNCKTLVQTFASVFEDLWRNATDTQQETGEVATGRSPLKTFSIIDAETARKKYDEIMDSAKNEIIFMTSSQGLIDLWKNVALLKDLTEKGVSVKIMAPTTVENLKAVQQLSKYCEVRHVPESRLKTTIVDGKHIFHSMNTILDQDTLEKELESAYTFYTSDSEYVTKTKVALNDVWKNAQAPSAVTLESILNPPTPSVDPFRKVEAGTPYTKWSIHIEEHKRGAITEKDVLNKILNAKRIIAKDPLKDISSMCGSSASAIIHPPEHFNLPDMILWTWHCDKQSSWGAEDWLTVSLWLNTPMGYRYVPVAYVTDNPDALEFRKGVYAGTPASQNCQLVNKDQFQVQVHGNTLFAGWTVPIPLFPPPYILPPSCILFEGYGELRTTVTRTRIPSSRTQVTQANQFNAFVTFFHPASKYQGPGTDGIFNRDVFFTAYPPT
jgi:sugar-specific transcriptional regulator TrmB